MGMFTKPASAVRNHRRSRAPRSFAGRNVLSGAFVPVPGQPGVLENRRTGIKVKIIDPALMKAAYRAKVRRNAEANKVLTVAEHKALLVLEAAAEEQLQLYKPVVIDRVRGRFETPEQAEAWFDNGSVPGFAEDTPRELVSQGHADWVIHAIDAIEAGVHA